MYVLRKGRNWQRIPLDPDVAAELRAVWVKPEPDDHVFTVEVEHWLSADELRRRPKDPKVPACD